MEMWSPGEKEQRNKIPGGSAVAFAEVDGDSNCVALPFDAGSPVVFARDGSWEYYDQMLQTSRTKKKKKKKKRKGRKS